jgi:radical SAM superfamily enzyme YgiQ (UPF0313 family)
MDNYGTAIKQKRIGYWASMGVGYLASALENADHTVEIVEAAPLGYSNNDIKVHLEKSNPDIIGISTLSASAKQAYSLIRHLKKFFNAPIILGGAHANCNTKNILAECPEIDYVIYGEAEETIVELVEAIKKNSDIKQVKGICYKDKNNIIMNPPREIIHDLDKILPRAIHLYDFKSYHPLPLQYKKLPIMPMLSSRGCPYGKCTFCFNAGFAKQEYRRHSPERVVSEIKTLITKYGVKEIAFWDDNFLINEKWVRRFCDLLKKENIKIPWQCYGNVSTVTKEMLKKVAEAGCWNVFYGFESGNQDLLDLIKKNITLEQSKLAAKWTHEAGMDTRGSFMLALPNETPEKALKTIKHAIQMNLTFAQFLPTHPEYGTRLYEQALKVGKVPEFKGRTTATYVPDGYKDAKEVEKIVRKAYRMLYFRPKFILKHLKRIKNPDTFKQYISAFLFIVGIAFKRVSKS